MITGKCQTTFDAFAKVNRSVGQAIAQCDRSDKAIPWIVIMQWIAQYGPQIVAMIAALISGFNPTPPTPTQNGEATPPAKA